MSSLENNIHVNTDSEINSLNICYTLATWLFKCKCLELSKLTKTEIISYLSNLMAMVLPVLVALLFQWHTNAISCRRSLAGFLCQTMLSLVSLLFLLHNNKYLKINFKHSDNQKVTWIYNCSNFNTTMIYPSHFFWDYKSNYIKFEYL